MTVPLDALFCQCVNRIRDIAHIGRLPLANLESVCGNMSSNPNAGRILGYFNGAIAAVNKVDLQQDGHLFPHVARLHNAVAWPSASLPSLKELCHWFDKHKHVQGAVTFDLLSKVANYARRKELPTDMWIGSLSIESSFEAMLLGCVGHLYERMAVLWLGMTYTYAEMTPLWKDCILHATDDILLHRYLTGQNHNGKLWKLYRLPVSEGGLGWISDRREAEFRELYRQHGIVTVN